MAWPPVMPPLGRANTTPSFDAHPTDHNQAAQALRDLYNNLARGTIAVKLFGVDTTGIGASLVTLNGSTITVTTEAGRRYRVGTKFQGGATSTGTSVIAYVREGASNLAQRRWSVNTQQDSWSAENEDWQPTAGAHTISAAALVFAGTFNVVASFGESQIFVEDVGPITRS